MAEFTIRGKFPTHKPYIEVVNNILDGFKPIADEAQKDFELTYATWSAENKPTPFKDFFDGGVHVGARGDIYALVNKGARDHRIPSVGNARLYFQRAYTPKTKPRFIGSSQGGHSGEKSFASFVDHPGFEGREFDEAIAAKWRVQVGKIIGVWSKKALESFITGIDEIVL